MSDKITIYPKGDLKERIERIAADQHRSVNAQVLMWAEQAVEAVEQVEPLLNGDLERSRGSQPAETAASEGRSKQSRKARCHHGIAPDAYCKICDG